MFFFWRPLFRGIEVYFKNGSVKRTGNLLGFLITAFTKERIKGFVHPLNFSVCFFHVSFIFLLQEIFHNKASSILKMLISCTSFVEQSLIFLNYCKILAS